MVYLPVARGVRLAAQDINPKGKHVLLLVHGWPLSKEIFEHQYNILPEYDICCISYDLRGYGDSDKPYHGYSYDRMADDLYRVVHNLDCKSVTLLGFSMGGAIATRYMARHKGYKVKKLILCGAACPAFTQSPENPYGMTREQVDTLIQETYADRPAMCDSFGRLCFANSVSDSYLRWFSGLSWKASGRATIQGLVQLRDQELHADLEKIKVPAMILHGMKDMVCPFPLAQTMNALIEQSFVVPFEESGHALFHDERDKFNACLVEFITE